ncbi:hypothetical protein [Mycobacterium sp. NPDC004974]
MPSTVNALLGSAGLTWADAVAWGAAVPFDEPGVYIVALSRSPDGLDTRDTPPISLRAVEALLDARPELLLDRQRPTAEELRDRLGSMWLADETVLYVGLAGTSVANRIDQYYKTRLGARQPHAGGWPIKTLVGLDQLWVHFTACATADVAEQTMIDTFMMNVSATSRAAVCDPSLPLPFANLKDPRGPRKRHGITGAREPRVSATISPGTPPPDNAMPVRSRLDAIAPEPVSSQCYSQPVRAGDLKAGRIRIPKATKSLFPDSKMQLAVLLRGQSIEALWDPRHGPDRPRSGVLAVGRGILAALVHEDEVLAVYHSGGRIKLS